jgi:YegS/Rv2252/BmrU family lipid kinase
MSHKVHVIVNPFSAKGKTAQRWDLIKEAIRFYYKEFKYIFTEQPQQATEIARSLLKDGFDLIIGVGGDGTLNEITNGYFHTANAAGSQTPQAINEEASLGIIPSGTGSDFIRFMKIPRDFSQSVERIKNSPSRKIDVGKIVFEGKDHTTQKYFINVADFGLGAEVIGTLSETPSSKRGPLHYYIGLLQTLKKYRSKSVNIVIDDKEEITGRYVIGAVANGSIFGGGMVIAPDARPDDGYFDLVLVGHMNTPEIICHTPKLYSGSINKSKKVLIKKVKKIRVTSDEPVNIEYDGELGLPLPAEFQCISAALNFKV